MTEKHGERNLALYMALIIVVYIIIQSFALWGSHFLMDDQQELSHVRTFESWWQVFGIDAFQLFRPVKNIIFAFFSLFPENLIPLRRASAVAIGCITFFPVFALFRRIFRNDRWALFAVAIWMLAPTLVSSVAWLSCINIQIMCAFGAMTVVLHDRAFDNNGCQKSYVVMAAICLFLACVSYEQAVSVCPLVFVFDFYVRPRRFLSKKVLWTYVIYALIVLGYILLRGMVGSTSTLNGSFANASRVDIVMASAYFVCQHFFVWGWPFGNMTPTGSYIPGDVSSLMLIGCWLILLMSVVLCLLLRRRNPLVGLGIAFAFVAFLPVSNLLGFGNGPYGDYYMGLPSIGLAVLLVSVCYKLFDVKGKLRLICFTIGVLLVVSRIFTLPEAARWAWLWADSTRAFEAGIEASPSTFANRQFYARICYENKRLDDLKECCDWLERRLGADSEQLAFVYQVRALVALNFEHNANKAMCNLHDAIRVTKKGDNRITRFYRGCVYEDLLNDEKLAEKEYRAAITGKWTVDTPAAADRLARLLAIRGELDEAEQLWRKAVRYKPNDIAIQHNLAQLLKVKFMKSK